VLDKINSEYVILTHEDYFLTGEIDFLALLEIKLTMDNLNADLVKMCGAWSGFTTKDNPMVKTCHKIKDDSLWSYPNSRNYTISHQVSMWRRDFLLKSMCPEWTPWEHELIGSYLVKVANEAVIYSYHGKPPIPYVETCTGGKVRPGAEVYFTEAGVAL